MKALLIGLVAAGAVTTVALSAAPASASVVCNRQGECWHTDGHYHYAPAARVVVHPDHWYFHQKWDDNHKWRDYHAGRGYYRDGVWVPF
jgi:hypothetical protein